MVVGVLLQTIVNQSFLRLLCSSLFSVSNLACRQLPVSALRVSGDLSRSIKLQNNSSSLFRSRSLLAVKMALQSASAGSGQGISEVMMVWTVPWKRKRKQLAMTRMIEMQKLITLQPKMAFVYLSEATRRRRPPYKTQYCLLARTPAVQRRQASSASSPSQCRPLLLSSRRKEGRRSLAQKLVFPNRVCLKGGTCSAGSQQVLRTYREERPVQFLSNLARTSSSQRLSSGSASSLQQLPYDISQYWSENSSSWSCCTVSGSISYSASRLCSYGEGVSLWISVIWELVQSGYSLVLLMRNTTQRQPAVTSLVEARGFRLEKSTSGPNRSKMMESSSGQPISNFFHHSIFDPSNFPARNKALHLATYSLPNISSSLIQSKMRSAVRVNVQSENALNSKRKGTALNPMQMKPLYHVYLSMNPREAWSSPCLICKACTNKASILSTSRAVTYPFPANCPELSGKQTSTTPSTNSKLRTRRTYLMTSPHSQRALYPRRSTIATNRSTSRKNSWQRVSATMPELNWLYSIIWQKVTCYRTAIRSQKRNTHTSTNNCSPVSKVEQSQPGLPYDLPKSMSHQEAGMLGLSFNRVNRGCLYSGCLLLRRFLTSAIFMHSTYQAVSAQCPTIFRMTHCPMISTMQAYYQATESMLSPTNRYTNSWLGKSRETLTANLNRRGSWTKRSSAFQTCFPAWQLDTTPQQNTTAGMGRVRSPWLLTCSITRTKQVRQCQLDNTDQTMSKQSSCLLSASTRTLRRMLYTIALEDARRDYSINDLRLDIPSSQSCSLSSLPRYSCYSYMSLRLLCCSALAIAALSSSSNSSPYSSAQSSMYKSVMVAEVSSLISLSLIHVAFSSATILAAPCSDSNRCSSMSEGRNSSMKSYHDSVTSPCTCFLSNYN